jgi:delta-aminolevulinic acid dehydratase/porphobilinogen synthase
MNKPSRIAKTHRLDLERRARGNRKAERARRLVAEPILATNDFIWPLFHIDGVPPAAMPDSGVSPTLAILPALP